MTVISKAITLVSLVSLVAWTSAVAQDESSTVYNERPIHAAKAQEAYRANLEAFNGMDHVLVLPGLVANRQTQRINVYGESTGIQPGTIVEFLLIDAESNKGYEALLWSHAKPSDIDRALQFIGMKPGEPFHPGKSRIWPKGERVFVGVGAMDEEDRMPIERLIFDKATNETLPEIGFVFTGSMMVHRLDSPNKMAYAADVMDPRSVASIFNDSTTVLDVPRRAPKGVVYGRQLVAKECWFKKNELLTVTLEPEYKSGRKRVVPVALTVKVNRAEGVKPSLGFELRGVEGQVLVDREDVPSVLGFFGELNADGRDPFVSVRFDSRLKLSVVRQVCQLLRAIDTERGIRVEPPEAGQLYYEAFLPDRQLLDRDSRVVDPWEVHLKRGEAAGLSAKLVLQASRFVDGKLQVTVDEDQVGSGLELRQHLDADDARRKSQQRRPGPRVLLVFASPDITYGELVDFLASAMTTHHVVHVFLE